MTECAICLATIGRDKEAYLYPCFHRFCFSCIKQWTCQQRRHDPGRPCLSDNRCSYACPLCKQPYAYVAYDCVGNTCRLLATCGQPPTMSAMPLTADQSRRRALYVTRQQQQQQGAPSSQAQVPPASSSSSRPLRGRPASHPQTAEWLQRELQAVLLTDDVGLFQQHVLGVLSSLAAKKQPVAKRPSSDTSTVYGSREAFLASIAQSLQGCMAEHAWCFAGELWAFLHSGLSVAAYDSLVFGEACDRDEDASGSSGEGSGDDAVAADDERAGAECRLAEAEAAAGATSRAAGASAAGQQMLLDGLEEEDGSEVLARS